MSVHGDHGSGAAKRRRERRLRMHWHHEQLTLRMVLATVEHHSYRAPRGQLTATRARAEEREMYSAPRRQEPPLPAGTQYFTLDDEMVPVTGLRPACLVEPRGPQERVSRHTMEQFGELAPLVQILDAPVPQMVDKLEDVLKIVDLSVPVQEIEVPKISSLSCPPPRRVLPEPQSAEQLVEVPLPAAGVVQSWVRDANYQRWSRVWDSSGRIYWWHPASGHVQWNTPPGISASPGRYINTGQG